MPKVGKKEFEYTTEGIKKAKAYAEEVGIPMSDAKDRVETYQLGGQVRPPTAPSMPAYKPGGKVDITDVVKSAEKAKRFQVKEEEFPDMPSFTKKKKLHKRKTKKMAKKILEQ